MSFAEDTALVPVGENRWRGEVHERWWVVKGPFGGTIAALLTRIKEHRDAGHPDAEAVALGLQRTGRIVTFAALLFVIAIGAFVTSEMIFIKQLGFGTAVAVLVDATIVRALLVPALLALLGRRNWWAPPALARLHARLGLREGEAAAA